MNPALPRVLPFAVFIGFIALDWFFAGALGMDPRWWYGVRTIAVAALLIWFWRAYSELHSFQVRPADWLLGVAVGVAVFVLWVNLDIEPLTLGKGTGFDPRRNGQIDWGLAVTRMAGAALVVPVMEELFWRSFVMRRIKDHAFLDIVPGQTGWKALLVSSAVFAVEHHLWLAGLLAGLGYGWLYIRTGNLWPPVAAHAVTNGLLGGWVVCTGRWEFW
jgi:CAAX prenyl protease-like protein